MTCLLCGSPTDSQGKFTDLFLLKEATDPICPDCWDNFEEIGQDHCPSCFKKGETDICGDCRHWQKEGKAVDHQALFTYNEAMKDYFSRYKFQGDYLLRQVFSKAIKEALLSYKDYVLVPIPLSAESYQKRRFNQVLGFLEAAKLPYQNLLEVQRGRKKASQSSKSREERLKTPQFFKVRSTSLPARILLVDDIYTTGKTLMLAKEALYEKDVKKIKTFSLAR